MAAAAPATGSGDSGRSPDKATAGQIQGKDAPHTTAQQPRQKKSLAARAQEMAQAAWQVSKIFSPPVQQPVLRVVALWLVAHRIVLTFLVALVLSYIAQAIPALKPVLISFVVGALVPKDPFSRPFVDIILEGARP